MDDMIAIILGGGRGTRLFPLTKDRSKPAVPIGGNYRLIDVAISNCLHAGIRRIFVLTQYQSQSLNSHISGTYNFDMFTSGFVEILAAEQTEQSTEWFQGTADAVRQSLRHVMRERWREVIILGGDMLYRMPFRRMVDAHRQAHADATIAMKAVPADQTSGFGIMKVNDEGRVVHFEEKPKSDRLDDLASRVGTRDERVWLASMGIYVFGRAALERVLEDGSHIDFGRHIIPAHLSTLRFHAHVHEGYWEDVGTIRSYYEANLALTEPQPKFTFYDARCPIYTHPRFLAPSKIQACRIKNSLVADGCFIDDADLEGSVIGIRTRIEAGARITNSLLLGADFYETPEELGASGARGVPPVGVGAGTHIEGAIIDKNARIGSSVRIRNEARLQEHDGEGYYIRDGIVIVPKGGVIRDGTII